MAHHYHPLENCFARILEGDVNHQTMPCGAGVALHDRRVLTCAHVINTALRLPSSSSNKPTQTITLDFPLSGATQKVRARVDFWDSDRDIAELILIDSFPPEVEPTHLYIPDELWDHRVQAFGFPSKNLEGTWADGRLRGPNTLGWIEVFDPLVTGNFIRQGFSGGPVWDENLNCCIGIIVAVEKNDASRIGYLIPTHKIADIWKNLPAQRISRAKQKREIPTLLPYRVNRRKQEEDLRRLCNKNDPLRALPTVAIIHGDDKQAHDMFLTRLVNEFVPELLKINVSIVPITRVPLSWPTHIQRLTDLSNKLTQEIGEKILHMPNASCEEIQRTLSEYKSPVAVEMELLTDDWIKHQKGVLEAILEFWNNWPALSPGQWLFVFLYITHKIPDNNWFKRNIYLLRKKQIFTQLEHCALHQYTRIHAVILSELTNILHSDTRSWARTEAKDYYDGDLTVLLARIRALYEKEEGLPMEPLALQLKEMLFSNSGD